MTKWIYHFRSGAAEGNASMKEILGGKGAGLAEMCNLNLPVPPGFTISTQICDYYYNHNQVLPLDFNIELTQALNTLQIDTGKIFGSVSNPLLLSIRSGSRASMPGMMDTILNLGLNDDIVETLSNSSSNAIFAFDSYRRFLEMYSTIVLNIPHYLFEDTFESYSYQRELDAKSLSNIVQDYKKLIEKYSTLDFLDDPFIQLRSAIEAVLKSWLNERAIVYRKLNNIPESWGTAINVQSMVFGNKGTNSATGVVFTRSPSNGENKIYGEFLIDAQGEDVVSGVRTPAPISNNSGKPDDSMQTLMPSLYNELTDVCSMLENHYRDAQDIEFTVENGQLFILQTRNAKRTAASAIKIAVDMTCERMLSKEEALMRIVPESLNQLLHANIDYNKEPKILAQGLPASPGAASGIVVFSPYDAEEMAHYHKVILVRNDTSPEDIKGMHISSGILTARGGMTSHAAVVARGMGKPCVCGISSIIVDEEENLFKVGDIIIRKGDEITIDGSTGKIFLGKVPLTQPLFSKEFETILSWADEIKGMSVRANAETQLDTMNSLKFGALGVGLCRTEHMFFDSEKIPLVREMIIAPDNARRQKAIDKLLPLQIQDFKQLFRILGGKSINIRLLDPPLHEFLPSSEKDKIELAKNLNISLSTINTRLNAMHEVNPMLGHRGCRLGISYPEIYKMQIEAILCAINDLQMQENIITQLELMIPLISNVNELKIIKQYIEETLADNSNIKIKIGTMIELPRAALIAAEIGKEVEFFSFGTNDLTQTTYGISRDDISSFLSDYTDKKIFNYDPFITIDSEGVGELIQIAINRGKKNNPSLKFGVCGEHAGDPTSIDFFHRIGIDYISCSPYRVPIARLAAAQAKIKFEKSKKI